jgi:hypothetical protein
LKPGYRQRWDETHRNVIIALLRTDYQALAGIAESMPAVPDDSGRLRPCTASWLARDIIRRWLEDQK